MNAASGTDQPPEGTISPNNPTRRTFLKGAGLAATAGLAAPLLSRTSARAASEGIILGVNAPGPWTSPPSPTWPTAVPGALGCRSYRDTPFKVAANCPTTFPGESNSKVVASIRPDPDTFLNTTALDGAIKNLIENGAQNLSAPQLTVWHEAGNLYTNPNGSDGNGGTWGDYDLTPQTVRSMHVKMKSLCDEVATSTGLPHVDYGCIIYGDISLMSAWIPTATYPLDWYGIDVYFEGDGPGSHSTHPDLNSYDAVKAYLDPFLALAEDRSGLTWPKINVCECNAQADSNRPPFFENLALWLSGNGGRRMLTFFPETGGPHSGPWPPSKNTISALNYIQTTYG